MAVAFVITKEWFFDRERVTSRMSRTTMITFRRIGGNVAIISRRSMRKRKAASKPGEPPSSHRGDLRDIYFVWDPQTQSVVIGPKRFNHVYFDGDRKPLYGAVPGVLEEGGQISRLEVFKWGKWRRADNRSRRRNAALPRRLRTITIAARPFMAPALEKSKSRYASLWGETWSSGRVTT